MSSPTLHTGHSVHQPSSFSFMGVDVGDGLREEVEGGVVARERGVAGGRFRVAHFSLVAPDGI